METESTRTIDARVPTVQPLGREHMPGDFRISLDNYAARAGMGGGFTANEVRIPEDFGPRQPLRGFEETYRNIIDYIVRITYRIWEDRDVEYIADTYADNSRVYDDYGLQLGNRKIISDTHHTTAAFSDIQLIADEIVWAGNDEAGFHTSHRTLIRGTNDGESKYGPATGKRVDVMVIANCVAVDNKIVLEHVLYNNSSLVSQMDLDLETLAGRMAAIPPPGWQRDSATWQDLRKSASPRRALSLVSPIEGFDVDAFERRIFNALWNRREFAVLGTEYAEEFSFQGPTNRSGSGGNEYQAFIASLLLAFPDLALQIDEVYWMGNKHEGYLTSVRWSADAHHKGGGLYGKPTGSRVQIWGITQHKIMNGLITSEWMLFNELDLMMQITVARTL